MSAIGEAFEGGVSEIAFQAGKTTRRKISRGRSKVLNMMPTNS